MGKTSYPPIIIFAKPIHEKSISKVLDKIIITITDPLNNKKEVVLLLSTNGGFTEPGFMFFDTMNHMLSDINYKVIATGEVASMGILMQVSAKPENRFILPHTTLILHETRWVYKGDELPISSPRLKKVLSKNERLDMKETQRMYVEIVSSQTGTPKRKILELMQEDAQLNAKEAVKYGFAHKIIQSPNDWRK